MDVERYYTSFDFDRIGSFVFDVTSDGNTDAYTVTISSGQYYQGDLDDGTITDFETALQSALNTARIGAGSWTVAWDNAGLDFTITDSVGTFAATLNSVAQNTLGMASSLSGSASQASSVRPYYVIVPSINAICRARPDFNPSEGLVEVATTLDGSQYGRGVTTRPVHKDWWQDHEPIAVVRTDQAAAAVPWTYQHLFEHVGAWETLLAVDSTAGGATYASDVRMRFKIRGDGVAWTPEYHEPNIETHFNVPFKVVVEARL